jgi:hypothetical protein
MPNVAVVDCYVQYVQIVRGPGREGRMGRVRTHMAVASSGWGPSARRFKSGLPDSMQTASYGRESAFATRPRALNRRLVIVPSGTCIALAASP